MIEWKTCPRCHTPCVLRPVSSIFDPKGEKYGLMFCCATCTYFDCNRFYERKDFDYLDTTTTNCTEKDIMNNNRCVITRTQHTKKNPMHTFFGGSPDEP